MARGFAPEEAEAAFAKGQRELEIVRRQAAISQLYPHQVYVYRSTKTRTTYPHRNIAGLSCDDQPTHNAYTYVGSMYV